MNIISQFVLGAAVGSLIGSKKIGNKALLFGGLCAIIPSIDWFIALFFEITQAVYIYGGITHSIVFCVLLAPILGWLLHKFVRNECTVVSCSFIAFCCMLIHCLVDVFSIQGVGLLEPFSHKRFSLSVLSDTDWLGSLPLVAAVVASWLLSDRRHKGMVSWFGIFLFFLYVAFAFLNKISVQSQFEQKLDEQNLRYSRVEVFPVSGSLFMWNCLAQDRDGFWVCYQSNLSKNDFEMNLVLRNDYYLFELENNPEINRLEAYTRMFYVVQPQTEHSVLLYDLRFGKRSLKSDDKFRKAYCIDFTNRNDIAVSRFSEKH